MPNTLSEWMQVIMVAMAIGIINYVYTVVRQGSPIGIIGLILAFVLLGVLAPTVKEMMP